MVLVVEDDVRKRQLLRDAGLVNVHEITSSRGFLSYMDQLEPESIGIGIFDVGEFDGLQSLQMRRYGHSLAERGWKIIFWSSAIAAERVFDACWFESSDNEEGARRISGTVLTNFVHCQVQSGYLPNDFADSIRRQVLSAIAPLEMIKNWDKEAIQRTVIEISVESAGVSTFIWQLRVYTASKMIGNDVPVFEKDIHVDTLWNKFTDLCGGISAREWLDLYAEGKSTYSQCRAQLQGISTMEKA